MNKAIVVAFGLVISMAGGAYLGYEIANQDVPAKTADTNQPVAAKTSPHVPSDADTLKLEKQLAAQKARFQKLEGERIKQANRERVLRERLAMALDGPGMSETGEITPEPTDEPTADEIKQRHTEIRARLESAWEQKNGREVLDSLHELETLGPTVYEELMKEWIRLDQDHSAANQLGIDKYTWRREWGGSTKLLKAAIDDPGAPTRYRFTAVQMLPEREAPLTTAEYLSAKLLEERDEHAIMQMAEILASLGDPIAIDPLVQAVRRHFNAFYAKRTVVTSLGKFNDPRSIAELEIVSANEEENAAVRAAADSALLHINPPVTGLLLTRVSASGGGGTAGLKTGDILTKLNNELIVGTDQLHIASGQQVTFEVYSEGALKDVVVTTGSLGIDYEFVTKR